MQYPASGHHRCGDPKYLTLLCSVCGLLSIFAITFSAFALRIQKTNNVASSTASTGLLCVSVFNWAHSIYNTSDALHVGRAHVNGRVWYGAIMLKELALVLSTMEQALRVAKLPKGRTIGRVAVIGVNAVFFGVLTVLGFGLLDRSMRGQSPADAVCHELPDLAFYLTLWPAAQCLFFGHVSLASPRLMCRLNGNMGSAMILLQACSLGLWVIFLVQRTVSWGAHKHISIADTLLMALVLCQTLQEALSLHAVTPPAPLEGTCPSGEGSSGRVAGASGSELSISRSVLGAQDFPNDGTMGTDEFRTRDRSSVAPTGGPIPPPGSGSTSAPDDRNMGSENLVPGETWGVRLSSEAGNELD